MPNSDGTLTKTEKEQLAILGIRKNITKASLARPFLVAKLEKLHEHFLTEGEEESLSGSEKQLVDFADMVVNDSESIRIRTTQFEDLLDKTIQLYKLAYGDFDSSTKEKAPKKQKTKAERLENFKDSNHRAINFINLQDYDPRVFKTLEEIVVFEYLLFLGNWYYKNHKLTEFFHSKKQFQKAIKIKPDALETALKKLEKRKLVSRVTKGVPRTTYFTLNYPKIEKVIAVTLRSIRNSEN